MGKKRDSRLTAHAEATAKLVARASYDVKKSITKKIPEDVTRAKAGAWLTLISPLTEWAGLRGDQLAHKRELLRLQREETLWQIGVRAAERLKDMKKRISPAPVKFLVPFLEKASLEEPDSDLVELWAGLLASAATDYNPKYVHFSTLISQMSSEQARIFERLIGKDGPGLTFGRLEGDFNFEYNANFMVDAVKQRFSDRSPRTLNDAWGELESILEYDGIEVEHMEVSSIKRITYYRDGIPSYSNYNDDMQTDYLILEALRLTKYVDVNDVHVSDEWMVKILFHHVTKLGIEFAQACKIPHKPELLKRRRGMR